ncbi:vWA domain-containing protein [Agilicoccus flavus]|uniref:vWA domain-containing protein n=1 Tax=Agilicoccus flavus TaxID=2775968 RepID=UPI001CF69B40|nr:VWA domain-containing protein [Agilicoccus flavus]
MSSPVAVGFRVSGRGASPATDPLPDGPFGATALLGFARALRAAGVGVSADRERAYLAAAAEVGLEHRAGVFHAGRATLCGSPADLERHDATFAAWFGLERLGERHTPPPAVTLTQAALESGAAEASGAGEEEDVLRARASDVEVLRHRDVATMSARERERLAALFAGLTPRAPRRRAHRGTPAPRGRLDARATLREQLRRMGEPGPISWRRRGTRPRRVVLLVDVSGSMSPYADSLLRLAHAYVRAGVPTEVFTLGTRLTRVTAALGRRDPERALAACGDAVPDWSGGTRLADGLAEFLRRWGRRGLARGAVVVVFSDGWERDTPEALGEQMRRLRALAHRVVWSNPHRGRPGYEPVQGGIVAALPHIDDFVAGHSLAAFEQVCEVVARA